MQKLQSPDNGNHDSEQNTEKNHRSNREIEAEIFFFDPYIAGQSTDPMQFAVEKVNDNPYNNDRQPGHHNIFAGL